MSTGFHRMGANVAGKLPGWSNRNGSGPLGMAPPVYIPVREVDVVAAKPVPVDPATFEPGPPTFSREQARQSGYTGDSCSNCQSTRVKVSGHCTVCEACGTTSGCS